MLNNYQILYLHCNATAGLGAIIYGTFSSQVLLLFTIALLRISAACGEQLVVIITFSTFHSLGPKSGTRAGNNGAGPGGSCLQAVQL